ncbi:CDP-diacylglycerol--glycerol-3-phosphate 3-phosphatidyltransferase [Pimephales promelas]|uniref:CDP-diacylglycerol--glycerol-3-phosphate 3-phosphatidyltransferase n=1 Tax=Pimephales promelas TaxID=90988 RepID=UPI0019558217|nr:CDP-diacylglycerol--glycerol-3-phosphate 3-phosphatidyltransferase [Pimephales promelas]KAG1951674.1 CDP-diacylglycerol--inositol 3-phosphatidyltransferase [Pimephales promelas]
MGIHVLLYVPNVIGYIRILLVLSSWILYSYPENFVPLYVLSIILDGVDGWVARKLQQTSRFGAWLDVVIDNVGRGMLWNMLFDWGWLVSSLEWCVFVCNHNARGAQWKTTFTKSPVWVQAVMAKGFKTPLGILTIAGLHVLPVWLYCYQHEVLSHALYAPYWIQTLGILVLAAGRLLCFAVEMWCIVTHMKFLLLDEEEEKKN